MSSKKNNTNNGNNPPAIICNLPKYKKIVKVIQKANKLKGNNKFINDDFSKETMGLPKQLRKEIKAHRDKGKVACHRTVVGRRFCKINLHHLLNATLKFN